MCHMLFFFLCLFSATIAEMLHTHLQIPAGMHAIPIWHADGPSSQFTLVRCEFNVPDLADEGSGIQSAVAFVTAQLSPFGHPDRHGVGHPGEQRGHEGDSEGHPEGEHPDTLLDGEEREGTSPEGPRVILFTPGDPRAPDEDLKLLAKIRSGKEPLEGRMATELVVLSPCLSVGRERSQPPGSNFEIPLAELEHNITFFGASSTSRSSNSRFKGDGICGGADPSGRALSIDGPT